MAIRSHPAKDSTGPEDPTTSIAALFLRGFWMLIGNGALVLLGLAIAGQSAQLISLKDAAYWSLVPLVVAARYLDITRFEGATVYGEPATLQHWKRYALGFLVVSAALWLGAHGFTLLLGK